MAFKLVSLALKPCKSALFKLFSICVMVPCFTSICLCLICSSSIYL